MEALGCIVKVTEFEKKTKYINKVFGFRKMKENWEFSYDSTKQPVLLYVVELEVIVVVMAIVVVAAVVGGNVAFGVVNVEVEAVVVIAVDVVVEWYTVPDIA